MNEEEIWKTIPFASKYQASSLGRIRRIATNNILNLYTNYSGYLHFSSYDPIKKAKVSVRVNRAIASAFYGDRDSSYHAAHNDGDRKNNRLNNIRWATPAENNADKFLHGTAHRTGGEQNGNARLTEDDVRNIRRVLAEYPSRNTRTLLANQYGVKYNQIRLIEVRKRWKDVS